MRRHVFSAMGTTVEAWLRDDQDQEAVEDVFRTVEAECSRFRADSSLSAVNAAPGTRVPLTPLLRDVLRAAEELRERTGGLVDPAVGAAVRSWGYDRTFEEIGNVDRPPTIPTIGSWHLDGDTLVREPGTLLDLGGIAKGWTCDVVVERDLAEMCSAGGDLRSRHPEGQAEITDPWGGTALTVTVGPGAVATSSRVKRRWTAGTGEAHHLIDPRTGRPATTPVLTASAQTATAAEAEAAAKAILLLGEDGLAWADRQPWIRAALVTWENGSVFATHGWEVAA